MKKKIIVVLAIILVTMTGCTKTLVGDDNKKVVNEKTGQNLTANILCLPEDKELLNEYQKNEKNMDVKLSDLPKCTNMKIYEKKSYNGLWVGLFVRPLAWCIIQLGKLVGNYGISVMMIGLIIRLILLPASAKTSKQQEMMKKAQPDIERIEKKYANKNDQESMMKKSQETLAIYQKYNINPSECIAFGDYLNDTDMLLQCGESYAMQNAHPSLKEIAKYTAPSNNDEGVMKILDKLNL